MNNASEKLRVIDILKENSTMVLAIGGFVWIIYSTIIMPIAQLQYQTGDIINNHIKTIQDEMISATTERKIQTDKLDKLNSDLIRIITIMEQSKIIVP